ncbi:MAG: hypothetical protein HUJ68_09725 [Clostridia bacterium]|nr:hypothetical protein [Clostridia bacterium]
MEITQFLNEEYSNSALYIAYRSLPSYIDGLKNSGRKTIFTIKKTNQKEKMKVSTLASSVIKESGYLHGESGIQGTIVTLSKDCCGSNNLPPLKGEGAFGTRLIKEAAAVRYIFSRPADYFNELFVKADDENLISQEFEGDEIEPRFYVPTLPLILLNGSQGIGVGFAADIHQRSLENVIKMVRSKMEGKKLKKDLFIPSWRGFRGTVTEIETNKYEVKGIATIQGKKVIIDELPISWDLQSYLDFLRKHKDPPKDKKNIKKIIDKYIDNSDPETDTFNFIVTLTDEEAAFSEEKIFKDLGLVETISENTACFDENNAVREFKDIYEIFDAYYDKKLEYMELRKKSETEKLKKEELLLSETVKFIKEVIAGTIDMKAKKSVVEADMKKKKYTNIEKLISMPLYSITSDKAKEMEEKLKAKKTELKDFTANETAITLWQKDLDLLEKELKKEGLL